VIRTGHASEEVASVASEWEADLVVAGKHGGHHGVFHVLGGTAEQLVAACHRPVLLTRSLPRQAPRTLLVPVDESRAAIQALEWAGALALRHGSRLVAHHAVTEWYYQRVRELDSEDEARKAQQGVETRARKWVEDFVEEHTRGVDALAHVASGQPGFQTLAAIESFHADLVVVGSHGLRSLIGDPLSRLSRFLVLAAPCSVFVVPDESE
jgi:nucleotide-binding universal stress UspA family protein